MSGHFHLASRIRCTLSFFFVSVPKCPKASQSVPKCPKASQRQLFVPDHFHLASRIRWTLSFFFVSVPKCPKVSRESNGDGPREPIPASQSVPKCSKVSQTRGTPTLEPIERPTSVPNANGQRFGRSDGQQTSTTRRCDHFNMGLNFLSSFFYSIFFLLDGTKPGQLRQLGQRRSGTLQLLNTLMKRL